jgi:hypothetical protein
MKSADTARGEKPVKTYHPVVSKVGWLPEGSWPELDSCRAAHEEAVAQVEAANAEAQALGSRFESEDEARIRAYRSGVEAPVMTDPAERERATAEARAKIDAGREALAEAEPQPSQPSKSTAGVDRCQSVGRRSRARLEELTEGDRAALAGLDREDLALANACRRPNPSLRPRLQQLGES